MGSERFEWDKEASRIVPLAHIDFEDERFRITTRRESGDLQKSIRRFGLYPPPLVAPAGGGFIIVSGFRRLNACQALGWNSAPVRVLPSASAYASALRAVAENSLERPLNLIETSRALNLLEQTASDGRLGEPDASALGLPTHPHLTAPLKRLCRMPAEVQDGILEEVLSFAMAGELDRMPAELAIAFARLFRRLKPSLNKQREIVGLVSDIAAREGIDPRQVLDECGRTRAAALADPDRNQQIHDLRRRLRQRRFPAVAAAQERFAALRQRLKLGGMIQLAPPRDFEEAGFNLCMNVQTPADVGHLRAKLDELIDHPDFNLLLTGKGSGFQDSSGS
jgi:ParB family chromosome partitioning protein